MGGVETYLLAAFPLLKARGMDSIWLYAEGDNTLWEDCIQFTPLGDLKATDTEQQIFHDLIHDVNPDAIHIHNIQNADLLIASAALRPTIITNHDYRWICPANNFFFKNTQEVCHKKCGDVGCFGTTLFKHCLTPRPNYALPFFRRIRQMRKGHTLLRHTIAPSPVAAQRLTRAGWDPKKISVLPYFCPLTVRTEPRPLPARPTISFIGRIAPNKGHLDFIRALGRLPEAWQGILAGDIDDEVAKTLKAEAQAHGCVNRLLLRPWATREEVLAIMDQSTVFIFPSLWQETLGIVALEALSRGVPVVATDIVGVGYWLRKRNCGRAVDARDPDAIAQAVLDLSRNQRSLLDAGQAGVQLILEEFTPDHHINLLSKLYDQILEPSSADATHSA